MKWRHVHINADGPPTVLEVDGVGVVRLDKTVSGSWVATLDYHLPERRRTRPCTTYEAGCRGAELWAERHMERLQREAAEQREQRWVFLPGAREPASAASLQNTETWEEREARMREMPISVPRRAVRRRK